MNLLKNNLMIIFIMTCLLFKNIYAGEADAENADAGSNKEETKTNADAGQADAGQADAGSKNNKKFIDIATITGSTASPVSEFVGEPLSEHALCLNEIDSLFSTSTVTKNDPLDCAKTAMTSLTWWSFGNQNTIPGKYYDELYEGLEPGENMQDILEYIAEKQIYYTDYMRKQLIDMQYNFNWSSSEIVNFTLVNTTRAEFIDRGIVQFLDDYISLHHKLVEIKITVNENKQAITEVLKSTRLSPEDWEKKKKKDAEDKLKAKKALYDAKKKDKEGSTDQESPAEESTDQKSPAEESTDQKSPAEGSTDQESKAQESAIVEEKKN